MDKSTITLYRTIQSRFTKVVWSHKIQEIQADLYLQKDRRVKHHVCVFSVLTTGGALSSTLGFLPINIIGSITSFLALALSYFTLRYRDGQLEEKAQKNKDFAALMHDLRNQYESLMTEVKAGLLADTEITSRMERLRKMEFELYKNAPHTTTKAVEKADNALKINKESTTEEAEIEAIVPDYLQIDR